jgi:nicotinamide mononucleotide transporter
VGVALAIVDQAVGCGGVMAVNTLVEILATLAGLAYVVFLIREKVIAWPFGIAGSLLSIYLFIDGKLYSEAFLYGFYVIAGFWGWIRWSRRVAVDHNPVVRYRLGVHLMIVLAASLGALALAAFFSTYTDAQRPYIDAFTTAFSFAATYMEVKKVLETWVYWIVLNVASIWLYMDRSLDIYGQQPAVS